MSHLSFKASQTAAQYVAHGLPDGERELFELHMMNCPECLDDVETWRLLAAGMVADERARRPAVTAPGGARGTRSPAPAAGFDPPADARAEPTRAAASPAAEVVPAAPPAAAARARGAVRVGGPRPVWSLAASVLIAVSLGLCGGWFLRAGSGTAGLADGSLELVSLGGASRGTDCTVVRLAPDARIVAARFPGAIAGAELLATRPDTRRLDASEFSVRAQPDGSWLLRLPAARLRGQEVMLEAYYPAAAGDPAHHEPVGCLTGVEAR